MKYRSVVFFIDTVSFSPLVVLVMVTLYPRMGTPSRVKGGLQEMRTVVELMVVTAKFWTAPNRPVEESLHNQETSTLFDTCNDNCHLAHGAELVCLHCV